MSPKELLLRKKTESGISSGVLHAVTTASSAAEQRLAQIVTEMSNGAEKSDSFAPVAMPVLPNPSAVLRWFGLSDLCGLTIGWVAAWVLASAINVFFFNRPLSDEMMSGVARFSRCGLVALAVLYWFEHSGHYNLRMPFWLEVKRVASTMCVAVVADGFMEFAAKEDFSRVWLVCGWVLAGVAILACRNIARVWMDRLGVWKVPTLLVASRDTAADAQRILSRESGLGYQVIATINDVRSLSADPSFSWRRKCIKHGASCVLLSLNEDDLVASGPVLRQLLREDVSFLMLPSSTQFPAFGVAPLSFFSHDTAVWVRFSRLEQRFPRFFKRLLDIFASASALLVLSPVLLVLAFAVKRDGGSVFYRDPRVGMGGRIFGCLKFRSMVLNNEQVLVRYLAGNPQAQAEWAAYRKIKGQDPRVTKVGVFMRRHSLDELPQLINVLLGDMSLVGPRPIMVSERALYAADLAYYQRVRPGITGLWQVNGRNDVTFRKRIQMDCQYIKNWSPWHDIAIIFRTIPVLLHRKGAY